MKIQTPELQRIIKSATRTFHHENTPTKPAEHIAFFILVLKTLYKRHVR